MPEAPYFVNYSRLPEAATWVSQLADALENDDHSLRLWIDTRELKAGLDWDEEIDEALRDCQGVLFVMTADSVHKLSVSKREWTRALAYKKLILPIGRDPEARMPFRLESRGYLDATGPLDPVVKELSDQLQWWRTPDGLLKTPELRLADAERDLPRAENQTDEARITAEINALEERGPWTIRRAKPSVRPPASRAASTGTGGRSDPSLEELSRTIVGHPIVSSSEPPTNS